MRDGAGPRSRAIRALATVLVLMALGGRADAQPVFHPATKVVLFTPAWPDPLVARLEAELSAVGIKVRKVAGPPESQLDAAVSRELDAGASAAIRIIARSRAAEVWTRNTSTQIVLRPPVRPEATDGDLSVIALRTVEFLRGTLLGVRKGLPPPGGAPPAGKTVEPARETTTAPAGSESPAATPLPSPARRVDTVARPTEAAATAPAEPVPPVTAEPPPQPPPDARPLETPPAPDAAPPPPGAAVPLEIAAGPTVLLSPGGVSPITGVAVIGRGHLWKHAGVELMAVFPLVPSPLTNREGTVEVKTALFGAAAVFVLTSSRRFRVDAAVGGGAAMIRAAGTAAANPDVSLFAGVLTWWRGLAYLRVGGGLALNRWLSLRADGVGGVTASRATIAYDFTDQTGQRTSLDRGSWGPAFVVASLALQARW